MHEKRSASDDVSRCKQNPLALIPDQQRPLAAQLGEQVVAQILVPNSNLVGVGGAFAKSPATLRGKLGPVANLPLEGHKPIAGIGQRSVQTRALDTDGERPLDQLFGRTTVRRPNEHPLQAPTQFGIARFTNDRENRAHFPTSFSIDHEQTSSKSRRTVESGSSTSALPIRTS